MDNGVVTKYYLAGAARIAMRKNGTLYYMLSDHLGSTSITLNSSGSKIAELRYKAWGETRYSSGTTYTTFQFTAQRNETALGLYFYNARWYDPSLGRFTSADTLVPGGVQGYDRYAYVNNNPIRSTDPTGHWRVEDPGSKRGCSHPDYCENGRPKKPVTVHTSSKYPDLNVVVMSNGKPPSQYRTPEQKTGGMVASAAGVVIDIVEAGLALIPADAGPVGEYVVSAVDVVVTAIGCSLNGQCFFGKPASNLPSMLVVNQDLLLTAGEFLAPVGGAALGFGVTGGNPAGAYVGSAGTDIVTSGLSAVYDIGRMTGAVPNVLSIGITFNNTTNHFETYFFITPP